MAADYLQKVKTDDPLKIQAATWNAMIDAAIAARFGRQEGGGPPPDPLNPSCEVLIQNDTGANLAAGSVLRVTDWVVTPVSHEYEVREKPVLSGDTPNASTNLIVILSEPIPDGQLGHAVVSGIAVCDILINDAGHEWAQPINGDNTRLTSADSGPARIAAKETSGSVRRAIVVLGDGRAAAAAAGTELKGLTFTSDTGSTADSDPGNGVFKWNHATQSSATVLYFDDLTADGVDLTTFFGSLGHNGYIYMQQADDSTIWQEWAWTAITDASGYTKFTVTAQAGSAASIADGKTVYTTFSALPIRGNTFRVGTNTTIGSSLRSDGLMFIWTNGSPGTAGYYVSNSAASEATPPGASYCGLVYTSATQCIISIVDNSGGTATELQVNADGTVLISSSGATPAFGFVGNVGVSGSFTAQSGETVTVTGGIITGIV